MDIGFAFDSGVGGCTAAKVTEFAGHIIMADVDQASLFTGEGVFHSHPLAAAVTKLGHFQWGQIHAEAKNISKFLRGKDGAVKHIGHSC